MQTDPKRDSKTDLREEHAKSGAAPGRSTFSKNQSRFFITFLMLSCVAFAGLIAYIVSTQQADPEHLEKMEQIRTEINDDRKEALKGAPDPTTSKKDESGTVSEEEVEK